MGKVRESTWKVSSSKMLIPVYCDYVYVCVCVCEVTSVVSDSFVISWTVTFQAPLSIGFSRQEYWSGLPCSSPRDLPDPGVWLCVKVKVKLLSLVWFFATPWTVDYHAPLSVGFSRQEYWSWLPFHSPGDPPDPGIEPGSPAIVGRCFTVWATQGSWLCVSIPKKTLRNYTK